MRALLGALLLCLSAACTQRSAAVADEELPAGNAAHTAAPQWAEATPRQRCYVRAFEENDLPGRDCMVPCIMESRGAGIGGGCWHICYSYDGPPQPPGSHFSACPAGEPPPARRPPAVQCDTGAGRRALAISLVSAAGGTPVVEAVVRVGSTDEGLNPDGSGRVLVDDPPEGMFSIGVVAANHFSVGASLIVPEGNRCDVRVELVSSRGYGF